MSTVTKCVPVAPTDRDSDALAAAVGTGNVSYNDSGLLCAIENYPTNGVQDCGQAVGNGTTTTGRIGTGPREHGCTPAMDRPSSRLRARPTTWWVCGTSRRFGQPERPTPSPSVPASYAQICNASTEVPPSQTPTSETTTTSAPSVTATTGSATAGSSAPSGTTAPGTGSKVAGSGCLDRDQHHHDDDAAIERSCGGRRE